MSEGYKGKQKTGGGERGFEEEVASIRGLQRKAEKGGGGEGGFEEWVASVSE